MEQANIEEEDDNFKYDMVLTEHHKKAFSQLMNLKLDLTFTEQEPEPAYSVSHRVRLLNEELSKESLPPELLETRPGRKISFHENLVSFITPVPQWSAYDVEEDYSSEDLAGDIALEPSETSASDTLVSDTVFSDALNLPISSNLDFTTSLLSGSNIESNLSKDKNNSNVRTSSNLVDHNRFSERPSELSSIDTTSTAESISIASDVAVISGDSADKASTTSTFTTTVTSIASLTASRPSDNTSNTVTIDSDKASSKIEAKIKTTASTSKTKSTASILCESNTHVTMYDGEETSSEENEQILIPNRDDVDNKRPSLSRDSSKENLGNISKDSSGNVGSSSDSDNKHRNGDQKTSSSKDMNKVKQENDSEHLPESKGFGSNDSTHSTSDVGSIANDKSRDKIGKSVVSDYNNVQNNTDNNIVQDKGDEEIKKSFESDINSRTKNSSDTPSKRKKRTGKAANGSISKNGDAGAGRIKFSDSGSSTIDGSYRSPMIDPLSSVKTKRKELNGTSEHESNSGQQSGHKSSKDSSNLLPLIKGHSPRMSRNLLSSEQVLPKSKRKELDDKSDIESYLSLLARREPKRDPSNILILHEDGSPGKWQESDQNLQRSHETVQDSPNLLILNKDNSAGIWQELMETKAGDDRDDNSDSESSSSQRLRNESLRESLVWKPLASSGSRELPKSAKRSSSEKSRVKLDSNISFNTWKTCHALLVQRRQVQQREEAAMMNWYQSTDRSLSTARDRSLPVSSSRENYLNHSTKGANYLPTVNGSLARRSSSREASASPYRTASKHLALAKGSTTSSTSSIPGACRRSRRKTSRSSERTFKHSPAVDENSITPTSSTSRKELVSTKHSSTARSSSASVSVKPRRSRELLSASVVRESNETTWSTARVRKNATATSSRNNNKPRTTCNGGGKEIKGENIRGNKGARTTNSRGKNATNCGHNKEAKATNVGGKKMTPRTNSSRSTAYERSEQSDDDKVKYMDNEEDHGNWLKKKQTRAATRRREVQNQDENITNNDEARLDGSSRYEWMSYEEWKKRKQKEEQLKAELNFAYNKYMYEGRLRRDQKECDKAYRAWLKGKRSESRRVRAEESRNVEMQRLLARLTRRSRALSNPINNPPPIYMDYYGYRF